MQMHSLKGEPWSNDDNRIVLPPVVGQVYAGAAGVGVGDGVGDDGVGDDGVGDGVGELVPQRW